MTLLNLPSFSESAHASRTLLMVGICLKNSIGAGRGPQLNYASPDHLRRVKLPHPEIAAKLKDLMQTGQVLDCWIWNTCNRFEVYATTRNDTDQVQQLLLEAFFQPILVPENDSFDPLVPREMNLLLGEDALHHLLRSTVGLNSGLPGETDVEQQLQCALRISECSGALTPEGMAFMEKVIETADLARADTPWRNFSPSYCLATLEGTLGQVDPATALSGPIVIIGSSNTTRSCVEHLEQDFKVDPDQITFFHRCHKSNGTVKSIRRSSMGCHRQKVDDYNSPEVLEAIGRATLVIWGIDRDQPVLRSEEISQLRNTNPHLLTMLDFNTLGSTEGAYSPEQVIFFDAQRLESEVRAYALRMEENPAFWQAAREVEDYLVAAIETGDFLQFASTCNELVLPGVFA